MQAQPDRMPSGPLPLAERAKAYGDLILEEFSQSSTRWHKRTIWQIMGACGFSVSGTLAGMAAMLWAVTPLAQIHMPWLLVATPLVFLATGIGCLIVATQQKQPLAFEHTRQRLKADMAVLKNINLAATATELIVQPMAVAHPYRLVLGAALVGAWVVRAHPWRWLSGSAVLMGILPTVISALSKQNEIQS